ncbi:MAG: tripartite tricarboxylate transporter permease [Candidatus Micrarchaeota archaeon]
MELLGAASGFLLGLLSGFIPGIHSNTIASIIMQLDIDNMTAAAAIAAMSCSHAVFGFIPAIFLFIPDSETVVSVLPGHRLLMKGRGSYALGICAFSGMVAIACSLLLMPVAYILMPVFYSAIRPYLLPILLFASVFLLGSEREAKRIVVATCVFVLSGVLGLFALQTPILRDPLLPVFCGMFAVSGIVLSLGKDAVVPKQLRERIEIPKGYTPYVIIGVMLGALSDLLPGISTPAQIAVFASLFLYLNAPKFLALVSSIAISHSLFSLVAISSIGKARTGAAVAISELIGTPGIEQTVWLVGIGVVSAAASVIVLLLVSRKLAGFVSRVSLRDMGAAVIIYLVLLVFLLDGAFGLLFMATGAAVGVIPPMLGVRRTHLMGAILVPSLVSLAGWSGLFLSLVLP